MLLTTGGFTNRYTVSAVGGLDSTSDAGMVDWREFAVNFVLTAVLVAERPGLQRQSDADKAAAADAARD